MKRPALAARRDAIRDMLRSGIRASELRYTLHRPLATLAKLARTVEVRQ